MAQSYSVQAVLSAVDNGFTSTFNAATNTAMSMGEKVSSNLKTIGNVTSAVGAASTAMGVAGLKSFGKFQQSLNTAAVVAGGTSLKACLMLPIKWGLIYLSALNRQQKP